MCIHGNDCLRNILVSNAVRSENKNQLQLQPQPQPSMVYEVLKRSIRDWWYRPAPLSEPPSEKESCGACDGIHSFARSAIKAAFATGKSYYDPFPEAPNSDLVGAATWTLLHTMSVYYPEHPSSAQQLAMRSLIKHLGDFYPCSYCAEHLRDYLDREPPDTSSRLGLSRWFCLLHNEVNQLQGKPQFDCSRVAERWSRKKEGKH